MNLSKIAVFVAVWVIAALIGYYQDWGLVLAGVLALPLWLLWAFSGDDDRSGSGFRSRGYGREARRRQAVKLRGVLVVIIGLLLLWWFPTAPWILNWCALGVGCVCVLGGFAMACRGWKKLMGVFALGVVMMCFGFVPRPQYRYVLPYHAYDYSPYGVKVIEGYEKGKDGQPLYGLADRYSVIVQPRYHNFYLLDRRQPFLALDDGQSVGVYDLERHELVVPFSDECAKIQVIGDRRYEMVDSAGRPFAHIELPKIYRRDVAGDTLKLVTLGHETPAPEELLTPVQEPKPVTPVRPRPAGTWSTGSAAGTGETGSSVNSGAAPAAETPSEVSEGEGHE